MPSPAIIETIGALRARLATARAAGQRVGFVPTMGFLHRGHLSLMQIAGAEADLVVVSIFVNPTQFGPGEDLEAYPRDLDSDVAACASVGVDVVFAPSAEEMYPRPPMTVVRVPALTANLCGQSRPTHFDGVCTVVTKLLNIVQPDVAVFGQKDFQQLAVIRRMAADLDIPTSIRSGPIVREPDGLAMSSRNTYLSTEARAQALALNQALEQARASFEGGLRDPAAITGAVQARLSAEPLAEVDYVELVDPDSLSPIGDTFERAVLAIACYVDGTRLIDNVLLAPAPTGESP